MIKDVVALTDEDTIAKAFSSMMDHSINQIPVVDQDRKYNGMIFAKHFISSSAQPTSKLKSYIVNTHTLSPTDSVEKATELIIGSGNRALPVIENGRMVGIVSETDLSMTADFGHAIVDQVMSGAIVIDENTTVSDAIAKMRRYNISRLPIINVKGILSGALNILDIGKIIIAPRERTSRSAGITGSTAAIGNVKVKDIMRKANST